MGDLSRGGRVDWEKQKLETDSNKIAVSKDFILFIKGKIKEV